MLRAGLIFLFLLQTKAFALQEMVYPETKEKESSATAAVVNDLPEETLVKHALFSVKIPKGWSLQPRGASKVHLVNFAAAPTTDFTNLKSYFNLTVKRQPPKDTLDSRKAAWAKAGKASEFVTWNGQRWLLRDSAGKGDHQWVAYAIVDGKEFFISCSAPESSAAEIGKQFRSIMESVAINR